MGIEVVLLPRQPAGTVAVAAIQSRHVGVALCLDPVQAGIQRVLDSPVLRLSEHHEFTTAHPGRPRRFLIHRDALGSIIHDHRIADFRVVDRGQRDQ